jgi:hypothetical protein
MKSVFAITYLSLASTVECLKYAISEHTEKKFIHSQLVYLKLLLNAEDFSFTLNTYAATNLFSYIEPLSKAQDKERIDTESLRIIKERANQLWNFLFEESSRKSLFQIEEKRLNINWLIENIHNFFADGVFEKLPKTAKADFRSAGTCIAFQQPTAAAFHVLRALEEVLVSYFSTIVGREPDNMTWGQIISHPDFEAKAPALLSQNLKMIKDNYRNPTSHSGRNRSKVYSISETESLLILCTQVVDQMMS